MNTNEKLPGVKLRWHILGKHIHTDVFMGEDIDHRALCGTLRMLPEEFERLGAALSMGADAKRFELQVVNK